MAVISAILALLQAIPTLNAWFQQLALAWAAKQLADHDADFARAHIALIQQHDQTLLEQAIGSTNAGKPGADQGDIVDRPIGGGKV